MKSLATAWQETAPEHRRFILTLFVKVIALLYWVRALALSLFALSTYIAYKHFGPDAADMGIAAPNFISWDFVLWIVPLFGAFSLVVLMAWQLLLMGLCLAAGFGLYRMQNWARLLTVILTVLHGLSSVAALFMLSSLYERSRKVGLAFGLAIQAKIVLFLLHPGVKEFFKPQQREAS